MTFDADLPLWSLSSRSLALAVVVLLVGLVRAGRSAVEPSAGSRSSVSRGLRPDVFAEEGRSLLGGTFVQDGLAIFAKRLFLASAALSLLGSLTLDSTPISTAGPANITSRCSSRCWGCSSWPRRASSCCSSSRSS